MVMDGTKASKKYEDAIKLLGGASAFHTCGDKVSTGGVKAVAECMHGLKKSLTESQWATKYKDAYG
jgi:hypothetical protein